MGAITKETGEAQRRGMTALSTGYVIVEEGESSAEDNRRTAALLHALPARLQALPTLKYIVVDAIPEADFASLVALGALPAPIAGVSSISLVSLARILDHSDSVEAAGPDEIRLERALLESSRGRDSLLAFGALVQLGRHDIFADADTWSGWEKFWSEQGQEEALCSVAAENMVHGYAIALATYAVAPGLLLRNSPCTFTFICQRWRDELAGFASDSVMQEVIESALTLADLSAFVRVTG